MKIGEENAEQIHTFFISADLGQMNDFTAITVIERIIKLYDPKWPFSERFIPHLCPKEFHIRHIERPELGTTYPNIIKRIKELYYSKQLSEHERAVVIDVTGVGRPVWDMMQKDGFRNRMDGIIITGGNSVTMDGGIHHVPKRDLITCLQVAFQNGTLRIAKGLSEADTLMKELIGFKVKITASGHDQYEAWREGIHDDIVLSAAMGVWLASQRRCRTSYELFE